MCKQSELLEPRLQARTFPRWEQKLQAIQTSAQISKAGQAQSPLSRAARYFRSTRWPGYEQHQAVDASPSPASCHHLHANNVGQQLCGCSTLEVSSLGDRLSFTHLQALNGNALNLCLSSEKARCWLSDVAQLHLGLGKVLQSM